jgi:hypothetical protein
MSVTIYGILILIVDQGVVYIFGDANKSACRKFEGRLMQTEYIIARFLRFFSLVSKKG